MLTALIFTVSEVIYQCLGVCAYPGDCVKHWLVWFFFIELMYFFCRESGDRITVERRIFKESRTEYRLMSHDGKVTYSHFCFSLCFFHCLLVSVDSDVQIITKEKRELDKILTQFNIFVGNPCCVLTQEESKAFIQGGEKQKYNFFLKVCLWYFLIVLFCVIFHL